ncbi:MAG TPA: hypothetical protein VK920_05945 [Solirubrobacterales bacterium]|nr:hypothetical protein [Solirubrobacterales bacterium]
MIVFSDHHKGARDGADDFWRCERAYHAALGYYFEAGHELYVLGDVEELWECGPQEVIDAYPETLALEAEFHKQGRYRRFWGNHDDQWAREGEVAKHLHSIYPGLTVGEALKVRVTSGGHPVGLVFLAHGHQGTKDSERYAWISRLVVRISGARSSAGSTSPRRPRRTTSSCASATTRRCSRGRENTPRGRC